MNKQFGRTLLTVMGLAVSAAVSAIPAQATTSSVIDHALVPSVDFFNPDFSELVAVNVVSTNAGYMLFYNVISFGGPTNWGGFGSIPASSVNVSGGSISTGKVTVTLNVNTCDLTGFTTNAGPCGTFDVTWVEEPASVGGSDVNRGDTRQTFPGGGAIVTNGETATFFAQTTGTAVGYDVPPATVGIIVKQTNVTVTIAAP